MLANRLKECRKLKNVSQSVVSDFLGIAVTTYASWEQGRSEPTLTSLALMADYFNTSTDYLLGITSEDNRTDFIYRQIANLSEHDQRTLIKIITALADDTKEQAR